MSITLIFATGRVGTAFLAQAYSGKTFEKNFTYIDDSFFITHESFSTRSLNIPYIKKHGESSAEGVEHSFSFLNSKLSLYKNKNLFITDHRVGRWLCYGALNIDNFGIIFIKRNKEDLINSFLRRWKRVKKNSPEIYKRYISNNWSKNYFHISDCECINNVSISDWKIYSDYQKLAWYWKETNSRWEVLKERNPNYIEVDFEDIKNHNLNNISNFLNLKPDCSLLNKLVNTDGKKYE